MAIKIRFGIGGLLEDRLKYLLKTIRRTPGFNRVNFIVLFGSQVLGRTTEESDVDIAISFKDTPNNQSKFRLKLLTKLGRDYYDVHIFEQLPIYIRKEVLKGKLLYEKRKGIFYSKAIETIKDFEAYKPVYRQYVKEVAR